MPDQTKKMLCDVCGGQYTMPQCPQPKWMVKSIVEMKNQQTDNNKNVCTGEREKNRPSKWKRMEFSVVLMFMFQCMAGTA